MFGNEFKSIENEILDQYLNDENSTRPWIIGFSGGKDSTLLLQLVWNAVRRADEIFRKRPVYVVCNDTLVENPRIVRFIRATLQRIQEAALQQNLPITVHETSPRLADSFWVRAIGLGYPAPNRFYRWCTERLKINPTTRFIVDKIGEEGEAIILLGTRSDESSARARSIKRHEVTGQRLRKHLLPNAFVYAPIKDIKTNDLWQYLLQAPPPWGGTHRDLVTLYRNANSGDCPLVIDTTTPSCGNSRFGCWVCTVVSKDKSMQGLIDNGEEWMEPLMDLREFLVETRDKPEIFRERTRRNGNVEEGKWGPYKFETRVELLRQLLEAQKEIAAVEDIQLITHQEMVLIQYHWYRDHFFKTRVSDIYNSVYNSELDMGKGDEKTKQETDLLRDVCGNEPEDLEFIQDSLALQKTKTLLIRKRGLQADLEARLDEQLKRYKKEREE